MPSMGYATIEGELQGPIEGSGVHREEEGYVEVFSFEHEVLIPRREGAALTAGRPEHREIVIGKLIDRATPKLQQALDQRERLSSVIFDWFEYSQSGIEELVFRIELRNAQITRIRPTMPDAYDPTRDRYRFFEYVSLSYESIIWSWGGGDVQFEATWQSGEDA